MGGCERVTVVMVMGKKREKEKSSERDLSLLLSLIS